MKMKENGGPAFPGKNSSIMYPVDLPREVIEKIKKIESFDNGMTLRDWFAGMALQGMISTKRFVEHDPRTVMEDFTKWAYYFSDSMLEERSK